MFSRARRQFSTPSRHAAWYRDLVPAMVPIALLGSTVYIALQLAQTHLSRERYLDQARAKVATLETELALLRQLPRHTPEKQNPTPRSWFSSA